MQPAARILCCTLAAWLAAHIALEAGSALAATPYGLPAGVASDDRGRPGIIEVQEREKRRGIFRFLFRDRRQREEPAPQAFPEPPSAPEQNAKPRRESKREAAKPRKQRRKRPAAPAAPAPVIVEKAETAKRVLVIGDFMAGALAKGLTEAYAQNAEVVVVDASNGSSGLVRSDFHDWPALLPGLVETHNPAAILALVGANDRQEFDAASGGQALGSDGWRVAYAARVAVLADAVRATGRPFLWAGLAPVKPTVMSRDYSTFNGIVREQIEGRGLKYVDIWNGFADEDGKFVAAGPDVRGQRVQLRNSDGLNFTRAGQRKLAFFVEQPLDAILGSETPLLASVDPNAPALVEPADLGPTIGPMVPMEALTAGGAALSANLPAAEPGAGTAAGATAERLSAAPERAAPAGRADSYAWPLPAAVPARSQVEAVKAAAVPASLVPANPAPSAP